MGLLKTVRRLVCVVIFTVAALVVLAVYTILDGGEGLRKFGKDFHENTDRIADFAKRIHDNADTVVRGAEEMQKDLSYAKDTISNTISIFGGMNAISNTISAIGNTIDRDKEPPKELPGPGR